MGGRGAASGVSDKGIKYGQEFRALLYTDNIKFIQKNTGAANIPFETMAADKGRVYALVNKCGNLKSIAFYDKKGRKRRQIDLTHTHSGSMPHAHIGYEDPRPTVAITKSDRAYTRKVERLWSQYKTTTN